jgi:hypothetical protein
VSKMRAVSPIPAESQVKAPDRNRLLLIPKLIFTGAAVFAAAESSWRLTGFRPTHRDLLDFDRLYRAALDSPNAVALIGSSRVLYDLDPRILRRELPKCEFYQLGIDGTSALPMLENLALDDRFHGHVLCEFNARHFVAEYPFRDDEFHGLRYVQFIQRRPYLRFLNAWFSETLRQHSALMAAQDQGVDFLDSLKARLASLGRNRREASRALAETAPRDDRFQGLNSRGKDNSRAIAQWAQIDRSRGKIDANVLLRLVALWVETIRRRGGDVVLIRMPVSGSLKQIEDETYPEADQFIRSLGGSGINIIESAKEPALNGFECADESHLDADDAGRFSTALARILEDRHLLTRAASHAAINRE